MGEVGSVMSDRVRRYGIGKVQVPEGLDKWKIMYISALALFLGWSSSGPSR